MISIDLPFGRFGGGYESRIAFYESFAINEQRIHLIRDNSHAQETLDAVRTILGRRELGFLFIDGDHTYEGVKRDYEMYSKLVRKGGIVAFHDICPHPSQTGCQVNTFWNEIRSEYKHVEIVSDWKAGWGGIGVLHM